MSENTEYFNNIKSMDQQEILTTIAFLKRVTLTGEEVPAFNNCINALNRSYQVLESV